MTAVVIALAAVAGLWLVAVEARTDDTGIEAGLAYLGIILRRSASSSSA